MARSWYFYTANNNLKKTEMKKLMIAAGFGLMFTMLSVMPAKAYGPRYDNGYGYHDRGRIYAREYIRRPVIVERYAHYPVYRPYYYRCR